MKYKNSSKIKFAIAWCFISLLGSPATADEPQSKEIEESKIFLFGLGGGTLRPSDAKFRRSISGPPELTQPNQWGYLNNLTFCYVIDNFSTEDDSKAVKLLLEKYVEKYQFKNKVIVSERQCNQRVDVFIIDGYHVNFLKFGPMQGRFYSEKNAQNARILFSSLNYYGVFGTFEKSYLEKISHAFYKNESDAQENKEFSSNELVRLAGTNSRQKIYYVDFRNPKDDMRICAVVNFNDDSTPIYALANILGDVKNNKYKTHQRLAGEFKDLDSLWRAVDLSDNGSYATRGRSPCNIFIGFAHDANAIASALGSNGRKYSVSGFDSFLISAKDRGFDRVEDYKTAQKIGADHYEYERLKGRGVYDYDGFTSSVNEMNRSGYASGNNIRDVLDYLDDKFEGKKIGRSAVWVKNKRYKEQVEEERNSEINYKNCLNVNGFYRTQNAAAKRQIERKCS